MASAWRIEPTVTTLAERFAIPANDTILLALSLPAPRLLAGTATLAIVFAAILIPALLLAERRGPLPGRKSDCAPPA